MRILILFVFVVIFQVGNAQQTVGCLDSANNQFDFWVGHWNVYDTSGVIIGENVIVKDYDNCLLQEKWTSSSVNRGTSLNYYNPADSTWNQLWLDNQGGILKLKGRFESDRMVLRSDLAQGTNIDYYYNQISWIPHPDGSVHQVWGIYNAQHKLLQTAFYGVYKKKSNSKE